MYHIEITPSGKALKVKTQSQELILDSEDKAISPLEALLAGLGGCMGVYLRRFLKANNLQTDFSITVDAELSPAKPSSFPVINVAIDLKGFPLDDHKKSQLLEAVQKCPAHRTLQHSPEIIIKL